ncbi:MAG: hypothetical protein ACJA2P_001368, partial [Rhodoferax sp.]
TFYLAVTHVQTNRVQRHNEAQDLTRDLASVLDVDLDTAQAPTDPHGFKPMAPQQLQNRLY